MIKAAFLMVNTWKNYYASSPYKNFFTHGSYQSNDVTLHIIGLDSLDDVNNIDFTPYQFVISDQWVANHAVIRDLPQTKFFLAEDIHAWNEQGWRSFNTAVNNTDYTLTAYPFAKFHKEIQFQPWSMLCRLERFILFPHHVADKDIYMGDFSEKREKILLSGSRGRPTYNFRCDIQDKINFDAKAPWVFDIMNNSDGINHEAYLEKLRKYIGAFTCNLQWGYTVAKHFEIPSQGTVLICKDIGTKEAEILGFNNDNCIMTPDGETAVNAAISLVELPEAVKVLSQHGRDMILKNHTTSRRLKLLELLMKEHVSHGKINFDRGVELLKESYG